MRARRESSQWKPVAPSTAYESANSLIARIAKGRHWLVTRALMKRAGIADSAIASRVQSGFLTRVHRGVYSLTPFPLTLTARQLAAVLACGEGALLSHQSAAALWGIIDYRSRPIHVARLIGAKQRPNAVRLHRPRHLAPWERAVVNRIPVTSVPRTLADLAVSCSDRLLGDAVSGARRQRLFDPTAIQRVVLNAPKRPGGARLLELVERWAPIQAPSLSPLQDRIYNLCASAGLPEPESEVPIGPYTADFLWRKHRLVLEADGRTDHEQRFDEDRARDLYLASRGYQTIRVTYRMIENDPERVISQIRETIEFAEKASRFQSAPGETAD